MAPLCTEKTLTSLRAKRLIFYPHHRVLLHFKSKYYQSLMNHARNFAALLSVHTAHGTEEELGQFFENCF